MRYCKYVQYFGGIEGNTYIEIEDMCVFRQVSKVGNEFISSNRNHPNPKYWHWLTEGEFDISELNNITLIDKSEFEAVWLDNNSQYMESWNEVNKNYSIGMKVKGGIEVFYPQGTIITIAKGILGVADYNECSNSTIPQNLYPGHLVEATVKEYDEDNMWLILDNPKVYSEEYCLPE